MGRIFRVCARLAGLVLKTTKCVCVPLAREFSLDMVQDVKRVLEEACPGWSAFTVAPSLVMLGCLLGPAVTLGTGDNQISRGWPRKAQRSHTTWHP